jgi:phospholipid transport system substrate-binding protein
MTMLLRAGDWRRRAVVAAATLALLAPATVGRASASEGRAASDPAVPPIETLDAALIDNMRATKTESVTARYHKLEPVVGRVFDFPTMVKYSVGPSWSSMSAAQQQALIGAFQRVTAASYAKNFVGYSGQQLRILDVKTRGPDKLVQTELVSPGGGPTPITYRMRDNGGGWKIIDVFYNGAISQLATRRSDFASVVASGGEPALLAHLNAIVDNQLK